MRFADATGRDVRVLFQESQPRSQRACGRRPSGAVRPAMRRSATSTSLGASTSGKCGPLRWIRNAHRTLSAPFGPTPAATGQSRRWWSNSSVEASRADRPPSSSARPSHAPKCTACLSNPTTSAPLPMAGLSTRAATTTDRHGDVAAGPGRPAVASAGWRPGLGAEELPQGLAATLSPTSGRAAGPIAGPVARQLV